MPNPALLTPYPTNKIALLCPLSPQTPASKQKVLDHLSTSRGYYASAKAQCTTWTYFTPSTRRKAPSQLIPANDHATAVWGVEVYSDKNALTTQQSEHWYRDFERVVAEERLLREPAGTRMTAWYPVAGFVSRGGETGVARPFGAGGTVVVMLALFTSKSGMRDDVVRVIGEYTAWVAENEPDVLTYCTMIRPKAPNEILLFERYKNHKALGAHGGTKEFKGMFKGIAPNIEVKQTKLQEFMELDNAFVGNVVGIGETEQVQSKL